jgi:hypothetical protein
MKPHELRLFFEQELVLQIVKYRASGLPDSAMEDVLLQWAERLQPEGTEDRADEPRFLFERELAQQIVKYRGSGLPDYAMQDLLLQWGERLKLKQTAEDRRAARWTKKKLRQ